jgi:hypothetical protein
MRYVMILFASVLVVGAAGCGTTDCPSAVAASTSCATEGMSCFSGADSCTCTGGLWQCAAPDHGIPFDLATTDMAKHD